MSAGSQWVQAAASSPPNEAGGAGQYGRLDEPVRHVVIVDDNEADLFFTSMLLKRHGFVHVHQFSSGQDAIDGYRKGVGCDLVLMDVRMPQMDGFDTVEGMIKIPRWQRERPTVYMMSAASNSNDLQKASESTFIQGFVRKPLSVEDLRWVSDDD
ncbi:MAG: response regulator [Hyphomicrobiales bacterium]